MSGGERGKGGHVDRKINPHGGVIQNPGVGLTATGGRGAQEEEEEEEEKVYSTSPRNGNRTNGNHLDICLSSPQKNGN